MKNIGIIGAMDIEIEGIRAEMEVLETKKVLGTDFYIGKLAGKDVVLALAGVGKVNAAICTQVMIDLMGVDAIVSVGVAGAISGELKIGDVVVASDLIYHDMDAASFGYHPGFIPRMKESNFIADERMSAAAHRAGVEVMSATNNKVVSGRMATGDQFISTDEDKKRIADVFNAACVEMESTAIAHTCYLNNIPFAAIRAISDSADDSADFAFQKFLVIAAERSGKIIINMISKL